MLAAVFSMQAFGYAAASLVSLVVITIVQSKFPDPSARSVDQIWRWVMGLGLIPAAFALVLRLTIPESPRYTLDIADDLAKAFDELDRFNRTTSLRQQWDHLLKVELVQDSGASMGELDEAKEGVTTETQPVSHPVPTLTVKSYFGQQKYWKILAGTSLTWL
jgi:PHS family inorganic phosphate transporter-like MFS transporter